MLYAGLEVSNATTRICVVDPSGAIVREGKVASESEQIAAFLTAVGTPFERVGLEAGALAEWIHEGLTGRARAAGGVPRDAPPPRDPGSLAGQDRPQRRPRHRSGRLHGMVQARARQDRPGAEAVGFGGGPQGPGAQA